jgi:hypothetical protein
VANIDQIYVVADEMLSREVISGQRGYHNDAVGGTFGQPDGEVFKATIRRRVPLDAKALKTQMSGLISVVGVLFTQTEQQPGMQLAEVELSVEINGEGQVSLIGMGGTIANKGGINLKFVRK